MFLKKELLLATTNQGKIAEMKKHLIDLPIKIISLHELGTKNFFPEKGKSFLENARGKSLFYSKQNSFLTLSEDSGLEVDFLDGAPGIHSSRFSGPEATDEENIQKLLHLMKDVPKDQRKARFLSCLVLVEGEIIIREYNEYVEGFITFEKKGEHGFGYDPIFFYPPLNRTFAEFLPDEKNEVSHRGKVLGKLKIFLSRYLGLDGMALA